MVPEFSAYIALISASDRIQFGLLGVQICLLGLTAAGLFFTAAALREQAQARDFENYLSTRTQISQAWIAFGNAENDKKQFWFLELMNLIEALCHLDNKKRIRETTSEMLTEYMREILPVLFKNELTKKMIEESFSGPDTFFEIRRFALRKNIMDVPKQ